MGQAHNGALLTEAVAGCLSVGESTPLSFWNEK